MDKKQKLQVKILLLCVKIIGGIHLKDEFKKFMDEINKDVNECN